MLGRAHEAAARRLRRQEAAEALLWCWAGARVWGSAEHAVGCGHLAACGSCGHRELCAENGAPCTPRPGLCSPAHGSSPLSPDHPDLPALHVPEGDLTPTDQSWAQLLSQRARQRAALGSPDQMRGQPRPSEMLSILSLEYVSKEIQTPAQTKTPACAENTHAGSAGVQLGQPDSSLSPKQGQ